MGLFRSSTMTCCPWSQLGVDSVERLKHLDAEDFEMLKKEMKKIPYKLLLDGMTQRGFANVPSVPTCPPHSHGTSAMTPPARRDLAQAASERVAVNSLLRRSARWRMWGSKRRTLTRPRPPASGRGGEACSSGEGSRRVGGKGEVAGCGLCCLSPHIRLRFGSCPVIGKLVGYLKSQSSGTSMH